MPPSHAGSLGPPVLGTPRAAGQKGHIPLGVANWRRTLLQPRVMMNDCLPTRLHSVSRDTEHLNTHTSSSAAQLSCLPPSARPNRFRMHRRIRSSRMDWLDLLAVQGTLKSLLQHHSSKASISLHHKRF